jgi:hypothetical protein
LLTGTCIISTVHDQNMKMTHQNHLARRLLHHWTPEQRRLAGTAVIQLLIFPSMPTNSILVCLTLDRGRVIDLAQKSSDLGPDLCFAVRGVYNTKSARSSCKAERKSLPILTLWLAQAVDASVALSCAWDSSLFEFENELKTAAGFEGALFRFFGSSTPPMERHQHQTRRQER